MYLSRSANAPVFCWLYLVRCGPTRRLLRAQSYSLPPPPLRFVVLCEEISQSVHAVFSQSFGWHWIACLVKMSSEGGYGIRRVL